jgi:hypothetical protein
MSKVLQHHSVLDRTFESPAALADKVMGIEVLKDQIYLINLSKTTFKAHASEFL